MKHRKKVAIASIAGVVAVGGIAFAAQGYQEHKKVHRAFAPAKILETMDTDGNNAASREEMLAFAKSHFTSADVNSDGKLSKAEIVNAIETGSLPDRAKARAGRMADRVVRQGDINLDGVIELSEVDNRLGKFYALADWNDDGQVELEEAKRLRGGFGRGKNRDRK